MATRQEIQNEISLLEEELRELHYAYTRSGSEETLQAIKTKEERISELEKTLTYEKGQFAGVVAELKRRGDI